MYFLSNCWFAYKCLHSQKLKLTCNVVKIITLWDAASVPSHILQRPFFFNSYIHTYMQRSCMQTIGFLYHSACNGSAVWCCRCWDSRQENHFMDGVWDKLSSHESPEPTIICDTWANCGSSEREHWMNLLPVNKNASPFLCCLFWFDATIRFLYYSLEHFKRDRCFFFSEVRWDETLIISISPGVFRGKREGMGEKYSTHECYNNKINAEPKIFFFIFSFYPWCLHYHDDNRLISSWILHKVLCPSCCVCFNKKTIIHQPIDFSFTALHFVSDLYPDVYMYVCLCTCIRAH